MVQQAAALSKKKEVIPPAFASITAADIVRAPVVEQTVALDLAPFLMRHGDGRGLGHFRMGDCDILDGDG